MVLISRMEKMPFQKLWIPKFLVASIPLDPSIKKGPNSPSSFSSEVLTLENLTFAKKKLEIPAHVFRYIGDLLLGS